MGIQLMLRVDLGEVQVPGGSLHGAGMLHARGVACTLMVGCAWIDPATGPLSMPPVTIVSVPATIDACGVNTVTLWAGRARG